MKEGLDAWYVVMVVVIVGIGSCTRLVRSVVSVPANYDEVGGEVADVVLI